MGSEKEQSKVRAAHTEYFQAVGSGDMDALAGVFVFPAVFKGFLEDAVIATNKDSLIGIYQKLIAAAPKATRTEVRALDVSYLRPGVYMLTMNYVQFGTDDAVIHEGRAVYFMKSVDDDFRLFAVI